MSATNTPASPGGRHLPPESTVPSRSLCLPVSMPNIDQPSEQTVLSENHAEYRPSEVRPAPVHSLSNEPAQTVSMAPVHPLSIIEQDSHWTGSEQGLDNQSGHPLDSGNGQGVDTPTGQPVSIPDAPPVPLHLFNERVISQTANQDKVLNLFRQSGHCVTNNKSISDNLGIPYGTVRHIIRRLSGAGLIKTESYNHAGIQGVEVWYCGPADDRATSALAGIDHSGQPQWTPSGHPVWTGSGHPPYMEERKKKKINLS